MGKNKKTEVTNMKKGFGIIAAIFFAAAVFLFLPFADTSANAAKKSAEEVQLEQLQAYLAAIIANGATQEQIDFTNQCIEALKTQIDQKAAEEAAKKAEEAARLEAIKLMQAQAAQASAQPKDVAGLIFVGDSRMVEMSNAVNNVLGGSPVTFIAQGSKGYTWFTEDAIPRIDAIAGKGSKIVINLGVNDLGNIGKYIETVNNKTLEWTAKGAKVYYATVNPVWENPFAEEISVVNFNNRLKTELLGVNIIDTHDYLVANGYKLRDGLHFDTPTTLAIYSYILQNLK